MPEHSAQPVTAANIRRSLAIYSDPDAPIFRGQGFFLSVIQFLLRSACLSLEIFIHTNFGKRYLTIPKLLAAIFLPAICVYLSHFDFDFKVRLSVVQPGFVEILKPNAERITDTLSNEYTALKVEMAAQKKARIQSFLDLAESYKKQSEQQVPQAEAEAASSPVAERLMRMEKVRDLKEGYDRKIASLRKSAEDTLLAAELELQEEVEAAKKASEIEYEPSIYQRSRLFFKELLRPEKRHAILAGLSSFFVIFSIIANLQILRVYGGRILEGVLGFREAHPHSSGEPLFIFNPLYRLANRFNAKTDLVKQFAEPALCYIAGTTLRHSNTLPPSYSFIGAWLMLGAFLIFIRVYLENRNRERFHLDRIANERNSEAFQLQNALVTSGADNQGPVQVRGK